MVNAAERTCHECNGLVPVGHQFCNHCGAPIEVAPSRGFQTLYYSNLQTPGRAKLILISGESPEGTSYHLAGSEHIIGRGEGDINFIDVFVSPQHVALFYYDNQLYIRDEGSLNGTFVRCDGTEPIEHNAMIIAGTHIFRFERLNIEPDPVLADGTLVHVSPSPGPLTFRVVEVLVDGFSGQACASPYGAVSVGRGGCDMNFPDDVHMSQEHFRITDEGDQMSIEDLGSRNGTFVQITSARPLKHGDYIFVGRQLLRVELA